MAEKKIEPICVKVTAKQFDEIKHEADLDDISNPEFLRRAALACVRDRKRNRLAREAGLILSQAQSEQRHELTDEEAKAFNAIHDEIDQLKVLVH